MHPTPKENALSAAQHRVHPSCPALGGGTMPTTSRPPGKHWAKMLCTMKGSRALGKSPSYTGMTPNPDNSQIHHASLPCYAVPREHRGPQNQPLWSQPCLTWWSRAPRGQPSIEGAVHRGVISLPYTPNSTPPAPCASTRSHSHHVIHEGAQAVVQYTIS